MPETEYLIIHRDVLVCSSRDYRVPGQGATTPGMTRWLVKSSYGRKAKSGWVSTFLGTFTAWYFSLSLTSVYCCTGGAEVSNTCFRGAQSNQKIVPGLSPKGWLSNMKDIFLKKPNAQFGSNLANLTALYYFMSLHFDSPCVLLEAYTFNFLFGFLSKQRFKIIWLCSFFYVNN